MDQTELLPVLLTPAFSHTWLHPSEVEATRRRRPAETPSELCRVGPPLPDEWTQGQWF